MKAVHCIEQL